MTLSSDFKNVTYVDIMNPLLLNGQSPNGDLFSQDSTHLNHKGSSKIKRRIIHLLD